MVFHVFPTQTLPKILSWWSDMDLLRVPLNPMDDHIYLDEMALVSPWTNPCSVLMREMAKTCENCFSKNTDMEFRCIQYVGSPGESVCLDKDWAGLFEFQMQQKSDDVRRYGIVCSKAAVLKAFLILLRWTNTPLLGFVLPSTRTWEDVHKMKSMPGWLVRGTFHWIILVVDLCMFHLRTTQGLDCPSLGLGQNLTYALFLGKMSSTIIPHRFSTDFGTPKWALDGPKGVFRSPRPTGDLWPYPWNRFGHRVAGLHTAHWRLSRRKGTWRRPGWPARC